MAELYQELRRKQYTPNKFTWQEYFSQYKEIKSQIRQELRRKFSKTSSDLHNLIYSRHDHDQVVSSLLKEDPKKAISLLLTPDSCGNSPLLLIALLFDAKFIELLLETMLNALDDVKLVHSNDQKQNFVHLLLLNKSLKLDDKIAVLQRIQKQKPSIYASFLVAYDTYDNIPLTYGFDVLRRYRSASLSEKLELIRLLTPSEKLADYVLGKADSATVKAALNGPISEDNLKELVLLLERFNDGPLRALAISKDVEVIKSLIPQRYFLLEGTTFTEISHRKSSTKPVLPRVRFLFERMGDKKADMEVEALLHQHYTKEIEGIFTAPANDENGNTTFTKEYFCRDILEKSLDAGFSVEEIFQRPIIKKFIKQTFTGKSSEELISNYRSTVPYMSSLNHSQLAQKLRTEFLKQVLPFFDSVAFNDLAKRELSDLLYHSTRSFDTAIEIFQILWNRISNESKKMATTLIFTWIKESLKYYSVNIVKIWTLLTAKGIDIDSKVFEANWIYQFILRNAITSSQYNTSLDIIKRFGGKIREFDYRSPRQILDGLFGPEPKPQKAAEDDDDDFYDDDELAEDTPSEIDRALRILAYPQSRVVLEALMDSGFMLPYPDEELYQYGRQRILLAWLFQKKGRYLDVSALKERIDTSQFPHSYEELLWLIKTLDINPLDESSPFRAIHQLNEEALIHYLHNVVLRGQYDGKSIENALTCKFTEGTIPYIALIHRYPKLITECMSLLEKAYPVYSSEYKEALTKIFVHKENEEADEETALNTYDPQRNIQTALILGMPSLLKICDRLGTENLEKGLKSLLDDALASNILTSLLFAYAEDWQNGHVVGQLIQILAKGMKILFVPKDKSNIIDLLVFNLFKTLRYKCEGYDEEEDTNKAQKQGEDVVAKFFNEYQDLPEFVLLLIRSLGFKLSSQGQSTFKLMKAEKPLYNIKDLLYLRRTLINVGQRGSKNVPPVSACKDFKSFQMKTDSSLPADMDSISFYIFVIDWVLNLLLLEEVSQGNVESFTMAFIQTHSTGKLMQYSGNHIELHYLIKTSDLWQGAYFLQQCDDNYPQIKAALGLE